jgi:hypothetical protein
MLKLKIRAPEFVLGVLLTVALIALGMMYESSRRPSVNQPTHQQSSTASEQIAKSHEPEPFSINWLTRDGVVFFTFVLSMVAGIQAALFLWQLRYMREGMEDARVAAGAARQSADTARDAFAKLERPYLFVVDIDALTIGKQEDFEGTDVWLGVSYRVVNYGKTPAIVEEASVGLSVFSEPLAPLQLDFDDPLVASPVVAANEGRPGRTTLAWSEDKIDTVDEWGTEFPDVGQESVWFRVVIKYRGPFTEGHETSVSLRCDPRTRRFFQTLTTKDGNYTH